MKALFCLLALWPAPAAAFGRPLPPDTTDPALSQLYALNAHTLVLRFSEPVTASGRLNYFAAPGPGTPDSIQWDPATAGRVTLFFSRPFPEDKFLVLTIYNIKDTSGNRLEEKESVFTYHHPQLFDVVIDEILPDPSPPEKLPEEEFSELRNTCRYPLNLLNWQLSDTTRSVLLPEIVLQPDSFLILCSPRAAVLYRSYGPVAGLAGLPTLNNNGDLLTLRDREGVVIHAVAYRKKWYHADDKEDGGWSLEMKDVRHPCGDAYNWSAAMIPTGGTPGKVNSVDTTIAGPVPDLLQVTVKNPFTLVAVFSQTLDSAGAAAVSRYHIREGIPVLKAEAVPPLFKSVILHLGAQLQKGKVYELEANGLKGCSGAVTGVKNTALLGITETAGEGDLLLSEILFHPHADGADFVEIYNPSRKILDLRSLFIASRNDDGSIDKACRLSTIPQAFFPGSYLVITANPGNIRRTYYCKNPRAFVEPEKMPVYPNDHGNVLLMNGHGEVLDEFTYDEKDHYSLLQDAAGVSLERIRFDRPGQDPVNWESAAADVGYATPTYRNTHALTGGATQAHFTVRPAVISPNNDGFADEALLDYQLPPGAWTANVLVFDMEGRPVRRLYRSFLLSDSGTLRWDGKDDHAVPVRTGIYILYVEAFRTDGTVRKWKLPVTVARPRPI